MLHEIEDGVTPVTPEERAKAAQRAAFDGVGHECLEDPALPYVAKAIREAQVAALQDVAEWLSAAIREYGGHG